MTSSPGLSHRQSRADRRPGSLRLGLQHRHVGDRCCCLVFVILLYAVGGIYSSVTDGFCDYRYKEYGIKGIYITPGRYHFDG